jgi:hypothetical protein
MLGWNLLLLAIAGGLLEVISDASPSAAEIGPPSAPSIEILLNSVLSEVRGLKDQIENVNKSLTGQLEHMNKSLTGQLEHMNKSLTGQLEHMNKSLTGQLEHMNKSLTGQLEHMNKSLTGQLEHMNKSLTGQLEHLTSQMDGFNTTINSGFKAVRNAFSGFPDLIYSSVRLVVSPVHNGNNEAQGTLVHSTRFNAGKGIIVSNRHVVVNSKYNCRRTVDAFVSWSESPLYVSKWIVFEQADVSIGILSDFNLRSGHQFLEVLPEAAFEYSEDLWGRARKNGRHLALHGKIVSQDPAAPHVLTTSVGGSRGCSGLGYANRDKLLTVIHTGALDVNEGDEVDRVENGEEFSEIRNVRKNCEEGLKLAMSGRGGFVDQCLVVLKSSVDEDQSSSDKLNASMQSCKDGWEFHARSSTATPADFVQACLEFFVDKNRPSAERKKEMCRVGWKAASVKDSAFVEDCLELGDAQKLDRCRAGWLKDRDALVGECLAFVQLSARNPRAKGLAAWVINSPDFDFVDAAVGYPNVCP